MYDKTDSRGVPISKGIPTLVQIAGLIGVVVIFIIGGSVLVTSGWGHMWPSQSVQRVDLK
ncbi:MAG: hypothetical protein M3R30_03285 [Candidatus Eremiobacteraeota bacterium]|nr:hypothetical protein [Candidatus Eremiobacteraeota bacterium]